MKLGSWNGHGFYGQYVKKTREGVVLQAATCWSKANPSGNELIPARGGAPLVMLDFAATNYRRIYIYIHICVYV